MRLDVYLTQNNLADSRERAKRLILTGAVTLDGVVVKKPALEVLGTPVVLVEEEDFVGRGGEKLRAALQYFRIDPKGLRALDIGASTGGFTHCLLQNGASEVVALDAGCGQLHPKLCSDCRVVNIEKYNARTLSPDDVGTFDLVVMDVSFISATYILPRFPLVMRPLAHAIVLIKPQFEAGRSALGKKGIVKHPKDRILAIERVLTSASEVGLVCRGLAPSPIRGGDGHEEYLALFSMVGQSAITPLSAQKAVLEGMVSK